MARHGGRVQLEQSDMHLAWNMAKMAACEFSHTAVQETRYLINTPRADVPEEKQQGVESPGHKQVKAAMERHLAMLRPNHKHGCFSCQTGTVKNLLTCWRCE